VVTVTSIVRTVMRNHNGNQPTRDSCVVFWVFRLYELAPLVAVIRIIVFAGCGGNYSWAAAARAKWLGLAERGRRIRTWARDIPCAEFGPDC